MSIPNFPLKNIIVFEPFFSVATPFSDENASKFSHLRRLEGGQRETNVYVSFNCGRSSSNLEDERRRPQIFLCFTPKNEMCKNLVPPPRPRNMGSPQESTERHKNQHVFIIIIIIFTRIN